ncbi:DUF362 domain-containing protein [bacterium]|nr:DUF362 domain-containing protein [bacterium]
MKTTHNPDRRDVLRRLAVAGAMLGGLGVAGKLLHNRPSLPEEEVVTLPKFNVELPSANPRMVVARGQDHAALVKAAIDRLGGISAFIFPGDTVVVKPNVGFDRSPKLGATSSPEVVGAVLELCRQARAGKIIVCDNPINSPEGSFKKSGIAQVAEKYGATVMLPRPHYFHTLRVGGVVLKDWSFFWAPFAKADKVIGIPTVKDHNLCKASLTMKNWYGLLGGGRNRFHQSIHEIVADLAMMMTPTLVVMDGSRLLMKNGPTGGTLADVKPGDTIVAGTDQVAIDAFGIQLIDRNPDDFAYIQMAHERGIGNKNWKDLAPPEITV